MENAHNSYSFVNLISCSQSNDFPCIFRCHPSDHIIRHRTIKKDGIQQNMVISHLRMNRISMKIYITWKNFSGMFYIENSLKWFPFSFPLHRLQLALTLTGTQYPGNVQMLHVPSDHIWRPDIVLYNKWVWVFNECLHSQPQDIYVKKKTEKSDERSIILHFIYLCYVRVIIIIMKKKYSLSLHHLQLLVLIFNDDDDDEKWILPHSTPSSASSAF